MATLKCKMCGGDLTIEENQTVCECEYCGSTQTIPVVDDEKKMTLFNRANRLRFSNEFDKASGIYESIVADFPEEAEAYWGLVLCKYGIEYVDDPGTGKKIPTCHRSSFDSVMKDDNFEQVMELSDTLARTVYRDEAKAIEELRKSIIEISGKEEPYDIFICYKETDENGKRTVDSAIAQDVYDALTDKGYRVFFSRISLEDKLGQEYEPYIFAALNSAKIMLAFGTSYDYYNAVWVKNEWSRFLKIMAKDKEKYLIPCYKNLDAYDMPEEFAKFQAQDMEKVGAISDLLRGIDKLIGKGNNKESIQSTQPVVQQVVQNVGGTNVEALLQRGFMALEDKEWENADGFFEEALNHDAQNVSAYLGKLMAECKVVEKENLKKCAKPFNKSKNYEKIWRFGDESIKLELELYIQNINDRIELNSFKRIYSKAIKNKENEEYDEAIKLFKKISGFNDADAHIIECEKLKEKAEKNEEERQAELNKKLDAIADALRNKGKDRPVDVIRKQIEDKENILKSFNENELELIELVSSLPTFEAEDKRLKMEIANIDSKVESLSKEQKSLGLFAGKKKKELALEMDKLIELKEKIEVTLNNNRNQMKGCTYTNIDEKIRQNNSQIEKTKIELTELGAKLDEEMKKAEDSISLEEAFELLKNKTVKNEFLKKYEELKWAVASVGDIYKFGKSEWLLLAKEHSRILVIRKYAIAERPYNDHDVKVTWETCTLRKWLNSEYLNSEFNKVENEIILSTTVVNPSNSRYGTSGGNNTNDKVFLLSIDEVNRYFSSDISRKATLINGKSVEWWLRSTGRWQDDAALVHETGSVYEKGMYVSYGHGAVRPALWIDISNL